MAFELEGTIVKVFEYVQVNEKFGKREFVVECGSEYNGQYFPNPIRMQCVNHAVAFLANVEPNMRVKVQFGLKGTSSEKDGKTNYFVNVNVYRIENLTPAKPVTPAQQVNNFNAQQSNYNTGGAMGPSKESFDDLPF